MATWVAMASKRYTLQISMPWPAGAYALALTLDPDKFGVCKPLVCRFCNKLFRKFCSDAVED